MSIYTQKFYKPHQVAEYMTTITIYGQEYCKAELEDIVLRILALSGASIDTLWGISGKGEASRRQSGNMALSASTIENMRRDKGFLREMIRGLLSSIPKKEMLANLRQVESAAKWSR